MASPGVHSQDVHVRIPDVTYEAGGGERHLKAVMQGKFTGGRAVACRRATSHQSHTSVCFCVVLTNAEAC